MNEQDALWNELNGIFLADEATDQAVIAYQAGDLTEMGRIIATHINHQIASRRDRLAEYDRRIAESERRLAQGQRYELTTAGEHAARLRDGVL